MQKDKKKKYYYSAIHFQKNASCQSALLGLAVNVGCVYVQAYSINAVSVEGEVLSIRCTEQEGRNKHLRPSISKVEQAVQKHSAKPLHSRDSIFIIFSFSCCHKCYIVLKRAPTVSCIRWINIRSERIT